MRRRARPLLGTLVEIGVQSSMDDNAFNALVQSAFARIEHIQRLMSFHDPLSELNQINQLQPGQTRAVSDDIAQVLVCALHIERLSGGLFNPGVAPQLVRWGYIPQPAPGIPPCTALADMIDIHQQQVTKKSPGWIDLGGIAKGYAVDQALLVLRDAFARQSTSSGAVVNAGGDLAVYGLPGFPVLIRDPAEPGKPIGSLELTDQALATSACYYSQRQEAGLTLSALVEPMTLRAINTVQSASVIAPTCMLADALTKVVMASGHTQHPWMQALGAETLLLPEPPKDERPVS